MRALSTQGKVEDKDEEMEDIFYTRCMVKKRYCILIINNGNRTNVVSKYLVEVLNLTTPKHPRPFKLQWLNDNSEVRVNKQVKILFKIEKYEDEVLFDVVPI